MPTLRLPDDFIPRATQLLLPRLSTPDEREAWLAQAFFLNDPRLYHDLRQFTGAPIVYVTRCITALLTAKCIPGRDIHSLALLLNAVRIGSAPSEQREIDTLVTMLDPMCGPDARPEPENGTTTATVPAIIPTNPLQSIETPESERTPTVFISYSHRDDEFAGRLIGDLQAAGHAIWIDTVSIKGGDAWVRSIADGIRNSYAFVTIISPDANGSRWVLREYLLAENLRKPIYPVLARAADIPLQMIDRQVIEFHVDYQAGLRDLLETLPAPSIPVPSVPDVMDVLPVPRQAAPAPAARIPGAPPSGEFGAPAPGPAGPPQAPVQTTSKSAPVYRGPDIDEDSRAPWSTRPALSKSSVAPLIAIAGAAAVLLIMILLSSAGSSGMLTALALFAALALAVGLSAYVAGRVRQARMGRPETPDQSRRREAPAAPPPRIQAPAAPPAESESSELMAEDDELQGKADEAAPPSRRALELQYIQRQWAEAFSAQQDAPETDDDMIVRWMALPADSDLDAEPVGVESGHVDSVGAGLMAMGRAVVMGDSPRETSEAVWSALNALMQGALNDPTQPLPVVINLARWSDETQPIDQFVRAQLGDLREYWQALLTQKRAALLFTGFEDLPAAQRRARTEAVEAFLRAHPELPVLVAMVSEAAAPDRLT